MFIRFDVIHERDRRTDRWTDTAWQQSLRLRIASCGKSHSAKDNYTAIGWLVHWALMGGLVHLVQQGWAWAGPQPTQSPPRCTKCNNPPINNQCTNFTLFDVAL